MTRCELESDERVELNERVKSEKPTPTITLTRRSQAPLAPTIHPLLPNDPQNDSEGMRGQCVRDGHENGVSSALMRTTERACSKTQRVRSPSPACLRTSVQCGKASTTLIHHSFGPSTGPVADGAALRTA